MVPQQLQLRAPGALTTSLPASSMEKGSHHLRVRGSQGGPPRVSGGPAPQVGAPPGPVDRRSRGPGPQGWIQTSAPGPSVSLLVTQKLTGLG